MYILSHMNESLRPYDDQYSYHGLWVIYNTCFVLALRVNYIHGKEIGYEEWHTREQITYYIQ
jgi:hypothetical protein